MGRQTIFKLDETLLAREKGMGNVGNQVQGILIENVRGVSVGSGKQPSFLNRFLCHLPFEHPTLLPIECAEKINGTGLTAGTFFHCFQLKFIQVFSNYKV